MNKAKVVGISLIVLSIVLAVSVALGGSYAYAKIWTKKSTQKAIEQNPDMFKGYMYRMQTKIKSNWNPPKQEVSSRVTVFYSINKDGSLREYKILKSSGVKELDNAAIEALKKSFPSEPLPEGFGGKSVDVQFTFDYNVHKKN